jgi:hypothetical protein
MPLLHTIQIALDKLLTTFIFYGLKYIEMPKKSRFFKNPPSL